MFREMRLAGNMTTQEEAEEMLNTASNGVLAVSGDDGYPYAVPVSFAYEKGKIYFHSTSSASHKLDAIRKEQKVSFCVVTQDKIIPEAFNTLYRSTVVFGKARILTDPMEIRNGIMAILKKYAKDHLDSGQNYMDAESGNFTVIEINIEHMTGKTGT